MEIRIQSVHFDADDKLVEFINKKLAKMETYFDAIISTDVILKLERTGQVQDKIAEFKIIVAGATLVAKETCKTFEEAIDLCSEAMRRQLIKHKEKIRN